jgi:hypothetical protein
VLDVFPNIFIARFVSVFFDVVSWLEIEEGTSSHGDLISKFEGSQKNLFPFKIFPNLLSLWATLAD